MENLPTYRLTQSGPEAQEILDQVNLNTIDIEQLKRLYQALNQSDPEIIEPNDTWPVANPEENVIYRVIDRVNTPPQYYSDYMWNGTSMVLMGQYNNAIDNEPTANSNNLVKSGGVYSFVHANGGAYDISAAHAVGGVLATYDDLADALGTNGANVPAAVRKGGMSIKFVNSSGNKYVQYRLTAQTFSTNEDDWTEGGGGDGVYDISVAHSDATYDNLIAALGTNGVNIPSNKRSGGMSIRFQKNVYATYSVVKTEGLDTEPTGTELESAPAVNSGTYVASQLSAFSTLPTSTGSANAVTYYVEVVSSVTTYTKWVIIKLTNDSVVYEQYRYISTSTANADIANAINWKDEPIAKALSKEIFGEEEEQVIIDDYITGRNSITIKGDYDDEQIFIIQSLFDAYTDSNHNRIFCYLGTSTSLGILMGGNSFLQVYYKQLKNSYIKFDYTGETPSFPLHYKVIKLPIYGVLSGKEKIIAKVCNGGLNLNFSDFPSIKNGDKLRIFLRNEFNETTKLNAVYLYKNQFNNDYLIGAIKTEGSSRIVTKTEDFTKLILMAANGGSNYVTYVTKIEQNDIKNELNIKKLSDYDFVTFGDSIVAWNSVGNEYQVSGIKPFDGWPYLVNSAVVFKSFFNHAVGGSSFRQSPVYGSYNFAVSRQLRYLELGSDAVILVGCGINDYNGSNTLGTAEASLAKTFEELDTYKDTHNFDTICDGARYFFEALIRKCSWKARIAYITPAPRNVNTSASFSILDMNNEIIKICKYYHIPVIDLYQELSFRNGFDANGETWKLAETADGSQSGENVHPSQEGQEFMASFIYAQLKTLIN